MKNKVHSVVCGLGEIGAGLSGLLSEKYQVYGVDLNTKDMPDTCNYLNICIPYTGHFVEVVNDYIKRFNPLLAIIHSTVAVGTTEKITGEVVHSPVMAKHPKIYQGLKTYKKFIGWNTPKARDLAASYFKDLLNICLVEGTHQTELMKILSLSRYGIYLMVADEMNRICTEFGADYDTVVKLWESAYNEGIANSEPDRKRPIYDPPNGKIHGHCVLPVMKMFNNQFYSELINKVIIKYE